VSANLLVKLAATGVARAAHYVIPTGRTEPIQTLLLEPASTNLCIRSEDLSAAGWSDVGGTVTINATAITAPDGTMTGNLLTPDVTAAERRRTVAFTGDGEKCAAVYLKQGTATSTRVRLRDSTAGVERHSVQVAWTGGVPTLSTTGGAGTIYPVEALRDGWYRILFSATGIVAANSNAFIVQAAGGAASAGTVYAWGAQAEDAVVPSSYIKTEGSTVTRNADSLYFPTSGALTERTIYARFVERGTGVTAFNAVAGFRPETSTPSFRIERGSTGRYRAAHNNGSTDVSAVSGAETTFGALIELRGVLRSTGSVLAGISVNGGAEAVGSASATNAISGTDVTRFYIGGTSLNAPIAFTHVLVAAGEQSLSTMRNLAGVV